MKKALSLFMHLCTLCVFLFLGNILFIQWKFIPVPAREMKVNEVAQLPDGRITFQMDVVDTNRNFFYAKYTTTEDGAYYITPVRSIIEGRLTTKSSSWFGRCVVDFPKNQEITSCYLGPVGKGILVWEEGMDLPPAGPEVVEFYK